MDKIAPPDPEEMNEQRTEWAEQSLETFAKVTGSEPWDVLSDLLCDLMHWCDRNEPDFEAELARARRNYEQETLGE